LEIEMNEYERQNSASGEFSGKANESDRLGRTVENVKGAIADEARTLGSEAIHAAESQAEKLKESTASHLDAFADALSKASKELGQNQPGPAAELVSNAAQGLESLSRSLQGKSTGEMVEAVRRLGRDNPFGFIAGSVLAGFALGRFAAAASPKSGSTAGASAPLQTSEPGISGIPSTAGRGGYAHDA